VINQPECAAALEYFEDSSKHDIDLTISPNPIVHVAKVRTHLAIYRLERRVRVPVNRR
jgi:hypothetical protein